MKFILSTIIVAILLFVLGWLFYATIFANFFKEHYGMIQRSPEDMRLWAIAVGCFLEAFFLAWIYPKGYKGGSPFGEGFKFGLYIGLLMGVPYVFFTWAMMPVTYKALVVDGLITIFNTTIAGIVTGLIYGKIEKPATTT
jgi:hypothetical protein